MLYDEIMSRAIEPEPEPRHSTTMAGRATASPGNGKLVPPSVRDSDSYGSKTPIHCAVLKGSFFGTYAFLYPFNLNDWSFKWSNEYNVLVGSHHSKGTLRLNDAPAFRVTNFVSNCCKKTKTATLDDLYGWGSGWLFAFKSESVMGEDCKTC